MFKKLILLAVIFAAPQFILANIATDIANGIGPLPATEGAKNEGVLPEDAIIQLITEGIESVEAVEIVKIVYGLTEECGLTQEIAINQMTDSGVSLDLATETVKNRCGVEDCEPTVAPVDSIITTALNTLPENADTAPLVALFPGCGIGALEDQDPPTPGEATSVGGGAVASPS